MGLESVYIEHSFLFVLKEKETTLKLFFVTCVNFWSLWRNTSVDTAWSLWINPLHFLLVSAEKSCCCSSNDLGRAKLREKSLGNLASKKARHWEGKFFATVLEETPCVHVCTSPKMSIMFCWAEKVAWGFTMWQSQFLAVTLFAMITFAIACSPWSIFAMTPCSCSLARKVYSWWVGRYDIFRYCRVMGETWWKLNELH